MTASQPRAGIGLGRFVLTVALLWLALTGLGSWMAVRGSALQAGASTMLIGWLLLLGWALWAGLGVWRAPGRAAAKRGVLLGVAAALLASTLLDFAPRALGWWQLALAADPLGALRVELAADGRRLSLRGPIAAGDADRVRSRLASAPGLTLVELASPGGRWSEAESIAEALRQRGLPVRVVGDCDNACVALFLAAPSRQLAPDARLGLQRTAVVGPGWLWGPWAEAALADAQRRAGLPESFVPRMLFASPGLAWRPGRDELLAAGLLGVPGRPLDVALPQPAPGTQAEHVESLATHDVWQTLDRHHPGLLAEAAARLVAARAAGASDEDAQAAAQRVVEERLPLLLARASHPLRELYWGLLADALAAVREQGASACSALLRGDTAQRRGLPTPLLEREARWLAEAAAEPAQPAAPRRLTALETEVLRRSLGDRSPQQLAALRQGGAEPGCAAALRLVDAVQKLPLGARRLAMRQAFDGP